jgi:hypothetical protein
MCDRLRAACAVHGEMRYRARGHWWVCPGWDGEGCCAIEAERVLEEPALFQPAPGSRPSQWGFRPAVPAVQDRTDLRIARQRGQEQDSGPSA